MAVKAKRDAHKCAKCHGTPGQHNVRDAEINVPIVVDGQTVDYDTYPQHGFKLSLAVAGS